MKGPGGLSAGDLVLLLPALALVLASWALPGGGAGAAVLVQRDGEVIARLSLERPAQLAVRGPLGESVIEVRDGRVRFASAPCSRQLCVHSGWLEHGGAFAACLPNHISLRVLARDERYDSINF